MYRTSAIFFLFFRVSSFWKEEKLCSMLYITLNYNRQLLGQLWAGWLAVVRGPYSVNSDIEYARCGYLDVVSPFLVVLCT
ncbi:hypothetical protein [Bacteroides sp.]